MQLTRPIYKSLLILLAFSSFLLATGCRQLRNAFVWRPSLDRPDTVRNKFKASQIQKITLSRGDLNRTITLVGPYFSASDTTQAKTIYSQLKDNIASNQPSFANAWYQIRIYNSTGYTKWALQFINDAVTPRLFMNSPSKADSPIEIQNAVRYDPVPAKPLLYIYDLQLPTRSGVNFLLQLSGNRTPIINEFRLYPYDKSDFTPVDTKTPLGITFTIVILFAFLQLFFAILSRDLVFPILLLYSLYSGFLLISYTDFSPSPTFATFPIWIHMLFYFFRFAIWTLLPNISLKITKRLVFLAILVILTFTVSYSFFVFGFIFKPTFSYSAYILTLLCYLIFLFDKNERVLSLPYSRYFLCCVVVLESAILVSQNKTLFITNSTLLLMAIQLIVLVAASFWRFLYLQKRKSKTAMEQALAGEKAVANRVVTALEEERKRISQDIHDEVGGNLAVLKIKIQSITNNREQLELVMRIIDNTSDTVRAISHRLMPAHFFENDLQAILAEQLDTLNLEGPIQFSLISVGTRYPLSKESELMLYRIIMELLHNCIKHSQASSVTLQLSYGDIELEVLCEDDGVGFATGLHAGLGLQSINSRVLFLNGSINIDTGPSGTTVIVRIPKK
jgi:signal transduction histidine kinase